jgi:hypothetical protein
LIGLYELASGSAAGDADAIVALRCKEASNTWEAACDNPRAEARTA